MLIKLILFDKSDIPDKIYKSSNVTKFGIKKYVFTNNIT